VTRLEALLEGSDRRSIGGAEQAARLIERSPEALAEAIRLMEHADPVLRMRSADALEKASRADASLLAPHKKALLGSIARDPQQEVRWHVLQIVARLPLTESERRQAVAMSRASIDHPSRIVAAEALTALFRLSEGDPALRREVVRLAHDCRSSSAPSMRSRAARLLKEYNRL
jgi:hypothetical protein